jgi:hypothetical protein
MKKLITMAFVVLFATASFSQTKNIAISFNNDYKDVFHLSLIIYTPDGKNETRVSDVSPGQTKKYEYPAGTEIFIADWKQEAYAMKGNDIKESGAKPYIILQKTDNNKVIKLSAVSVQRNNNKEEVAAAKKPDANDALGTWVIDLRPTPESEPYIKEFKFTKIDGKNFDGEFYGYPFSGGFLNTDWDKIYFAFTTADQSGTYYHSGYIGGNKVFGMSLNENRKLMLPWRGTKVN